MTITEWELRHALRHNFPYPVRCADCGAAVRDVLRVFPECGNASDGGLWRWVCVACSGPWTVDPGTAYTAGGCCHDEDDEHEDPARAAAEASAASRREGEA